ncbi:hypothetical protein Cgig2_007608 [Carnegiea gigantea]|uniref:At3g05675-like ankyrin-like domain-containing protein n=1 Tax=Carnegiea gigantea TaxID=171969 RepID=A0A9Q1JUR2_9CARY|nr:hypothetical protein Cgig2_007608 [Carnegiea gigantea]
MAASTTTTAEPKRRHHREITLSSSPTAAEPSPHSPQPPPMPATFFSSSSPSSLYPYPSNPTYPSTFSNFNSALTAGLLNPMSPPPQARPCPTLYQMMASDPSDDDVSSSSVITSPPPSSSSLVVEKQGIIRQRISRILGNRSPGRQFNEMNSSDIRVILSSRDGYSVDLSVHCPILVGHSRFFAGKLRGNGLVGVGQLTVELTDCEEVEVYVETLKLMYCRDLRRRLMRENVSKVLGILKVSAAIGFDAGVLSCLEYLEATPWSEDEEEKVPSLLSELHIKGRDASEVLQRVCPGTTAATEQNFDENEVLLKLLNIVLEGKDEKARRDMKGLISKMLSESANQNDLTNESLYSACDGCLRKLGHHFLRAAASDFLEVDQIARQADNLHWILDILIDRQIAEDFLKTWVSQSEMSKAHSSVPPLHRFEVSRVTGRLFMGIGKGQVLASKDLRCLLLQTWLVPFYDDFGWMRRASKGLDRHSIEDGLSNTILTLPLAGQQDIFLAWFDRFLNSGEDCPNIRRGFEVWWRRAFWRRKGDQPD